MYCVLVTGIPASGKTTMAEYLSERLDLPMLSKDRAKELLFDNVGFRSREEKVALGTAAMELCYYFARQMIARRKPFLLENNFENASKPGLLALLQDSGYRAVTVLLTGDYQTIYQRFLRRDQSPDRHRGHIVNTVYPEPQGARAPYAPMSFEQFVSGIESRGMAGFDIGGPRVTVDTTDFAKVDCGAVADQIERLLADTGN